MTTTKPTTSSGATAKNQSIDKKKCITPEFRVSYPSVFKAKAFGDQEAKFSLTMLFDKKLDLSKPASVGSMSLKHAAFNAATEKWGPKENWPKKLKLPFRDGDDERPDTPGYAGMIFVPANSKNQPGLVDQRLQPILDERDFYAGCYARAELIAFAYDTKGNRGVAFALQNVQKLRDGEPFSGRKAAESVFDAVADDSDNSDNYSDDDINDALGI